MTREKRHSSQFDLVVLDYRIPAQEVEDGKNDPKQAIAAIM